MRNITSLGQARDYGDRLSKLLKKYRELANFRLTQGDLASRVGVSARSIRDWESGINFPTARNLKKIIEVYHTSGLFASGKEREQAEELWILRQGEDLSNTFPLFDASWLESVSSVKEKETDVKLDQQPPDQIATKIEKNVTLSPTLAVSGNLPQQLTSFIGREKELTELMQLLQKTRLLTMVGTGGIGKTRLTQEVAHRLQESAQASYPDGIWWVDLTPLTEPQQVAQAINSALIVERRQESDLYELLQKFLQPKKLLLVLDNCEHIVEAVCSLVSRLLGDCPSLQILATSRESLNLSGEQVWLLAGLNVPSRQRNQTQPEDLENSAAVRLFVERARTVQSLFELTPDNSGAVLEICRQLNGLPLAIELAAARVKGVGVEQISRRLQQNFKLLSGGNRTYTPHHQTVQAMIDWSYNLLSGEEQIVLRRMAVFRGDFSLEAAEAVLGGNAGPCSERIDPDDVLILLLQLVNKSLVVAVSSETHTEARYRQLEMVRQYSQEKLEASGEATYLAYKHCAFYTGFVKDGYPEFFSYQSAKWADRLEKENANLRAALTWALAHSQDEPGIGPVQSGEMALHLSAGLGRFWFLKSYVSEGERWLKAALALEELAEREDLKAVRALAYFYLGTILSESFDQALEYLTISLALFEELGDKFYTAGTLGNLGLTYFIKGDYAEAKIFLFRSLALLREIDDHILLGYNIGNLGVIAMYQGDIDEALTLFKEGETYSRQNNDPYALGNSLINLGLISRMKQDLPQALSKTEQALQIFREIGFKQGVTRALCNLSNIQIIMQNYEKARLLAKKAASIGEELNDSATLSYVYNNLAVINVKEGNLTEARRISKQSLEMRQKSGDLKGIVETLYTFAMLAAAMDCWKDFVWIYSASDTLRRKVDISQFYLNMQTELDHLNEQVGHHLDPETRNRLKVKGQTESLEDIIKQVLA